MRRLLLLVVLLSCGGQATINCHEFGFEDCQSASKRRRCDQFKFSPECVLACNSLEANPDLAFLANLVFWNAPPQLVRVVAEVLRHVPHDLRRQADFYDVFAGRKHASRVWASAGRHIQTMEVLDAPWSGILSHEGFALVLCQCVMMRYGSCALLGPVCSSFVWVSRSKTWRDWDRMTGDERRMPVLNGNRMVSRVTLIL